MQSFARIGQLVERAHLLVRVWTQIREVPTAVFNETIQHLITDGWKTCYKYDGFDAWIDYGRVDLMKNGRKLRCVWTNWTQGEISGRRDLLEEIARRYGLCDPSRKSGSWLA